MSQTIIFNLHQVVEGLWVPEPWLCSVDADHQPLDLLKRTSSAQLQEWGITLSADLAPLLDLTAKLTFSALDAHFSRVESRKKIGLTDLWNDKKVRPGVESYISRLTQQFYQLLLIHPHPVCLDAAQKPVLRHHLLKIISPGGQAVLHLKKLSGTLDYRLQLTHPDGRAVQPRQLKVLTLTTPAWVAVQGHLVSFAGISGKMITPFLHKDVLQVDQAHEKTWFHQFLRKNIDRDAQVISEGFELEEQQTLQATRLTIVKHLFENKLLLKAHFEYPEMTFENGDGISIRSKIIIPEEEAAAVRIIKTIRQPDAEQQAIAHLLSLGLVAHDHLFFWPAGDNLAALVDFLIQQTDNLANAGIYCPLNHPETDQRISTDPARVETMASAVDDWFEVQVMVNIGTYQFSFKTFAPYIKEGKTEFVLPDDTVFLIPAPWFTRYREVAEFLLSQDTLTEDEPLRVHKTHTGLLNALELSSPKTLTDPHLQPLSTAWAGRELLQAALRPYQLQGVQFILQVWQSELGVCLADDMGLGKTLQAIAVLAHYKSQQKKKIAGPVHHTTAAVQLNLFEEDFTEPTLSSLKALIVVPAALIYNWTAELTRFCAALSVYVHLGPCRKNTLQSLVDADICLTSYHTLREDSSLFTALTWDFTIIDESQTIKNRDAEISKTIRQLKSKHRLALSGTPVENSLADVWALFNFLNPPLFGSFPSFQRQYLWRIERDGDQQVKTRLRDYLAPYVLRRRKQEVAPELPQLSRQVMLVTMAEAQNDLYDRTKSALRNQILGLDQDPSFSFNALQALLRLRQLACHPALTGHADMPSSKMEAVLDQYQLIRAQGSKVLIFSSFEQHVLLYKHWLEAEGHPYAWISGRVSAAERAREVQRFQEQPDVQVFLITLRAGGTGLNLTAAEYVFLLDPWWNPQAEEQAIARAHRIGQDKPVHSMRFITRNTVEEKILHLQAHKLHLGAGLIDDELPPFTREELRELFR